MIFIFGLVPMIWKCQGNLRGVCSCSEVSFQKMIVMFGLVPMSWTCQANFRGICSCSEVSFQKMIFIFGLVPMIWKWQVNFRGFAAVLRSLFKRWYSFLDWCPRFESVRSISGGVQLLLGLFSKDDIHIWIGAHDLEMAGQFQGVCSCS